MLYLLVFLSSANVVFYNVMNYSPKLHLYLKCNSWFLISAFCTYLLNNLHVIVVKTLQNIVLSLTKNVQHLKNENLLTMKKAFSKNDFELGFSVQKQLDGREVHISYTTDNQ